jgi:SAM-dependent methyltransferase
MYKAVRLISRRSTGIRRLSSRHFYEYLSKLDKNGEVTLMNHGYVDLDPDTRPIPLDAEDEDNRYCLHLYHHVAGAIDLSGLDVLDVGSGRGGGAAYVKRYLAPHSMTGVDISNKAIAFSQRSYAGEGLRYLHGDAEDLPFADVTFDAVINIESSHCYGVMAQFLREVYRVLRPGGHLLWTDARPPHQLRALYTDIRQSGFAVIKVENITANVLAAMALRGECNKALIDRIVPRYARGAFYHFAGIEGTWIHSLLLSGKLEYMHLVLCKARLPTGVSAGAPQKGEAAV